jgi:Xaa-Pro aminopeptidase
VGLLRRAVLEVEKAWNAVRDAQQKAFELVAPGVRCRDVDARARAVLESHGFPADTAR